MSYDEKYNPYSMMLGMPVAQFELRIQYKIEISKIDPKDVDKGVVVYFVPDMDIPHGFLFPEIRLIYKDWAKFSGIKMYGRDGHVKISLNDEEIKDIVESWNLEYRLPELKEALKNGR